MLARAERWLLRPGTERRLALLRILVGTFAVVWVLASADELVDLADLDPARFRPVGVVALSGVGPVSAASTAAIIAVTVACGAGFVLARWYRLTAPAFALGLLWLTTYQNCWGKLLHTENLLVVHVLVLAASPAADRFLPPRGARPTSRHGWPVAVMALATTLAYFVAGVAKLRHTGLDWLDPSTLRDWVAYDLIRKDLFGDPYLPIGPHAVPHLWLFAPPAVFTLLVELGAPVALIWRRVAIPWAVAAWTLHLAVFAVMYVAFPYHLAGLALVPVVWCARPSAPLEEAPAGQNRRRSVSIP